MPWKKAVRETNTMGHPQKSKAELWHDMALFLISNSVSNARCPECGCNSLSVRDMEYGCGTSRGVQRYLMCASCGAFQVVNLKRAGDQSGIKA